MLFNANYMPQARKVPLKDAHLNPTDMQLRFSIVPTLSCISPNLSVVDNWCLERQLQDTWLTRSRPRHAMLTAKRTQKHFNLAENTRQFCSAALQQRLAWAL